MLTEMLRLYLTLKMVINYYKQIKDKKMEILEYLKSNRQPAMFLIRNFEFNEESQIINGGELISVSNEPDVLFSKVPKPDYPEDERIQKIFDEEFGILNQENFEEDTDYNTFNTRPYELYGNENHDREYFGESYTIAFIIPPDIDLIKDFIQDFFNRHYGNGKKICEFGIADFWSDVLDRHIVYPPEEDSIVCDLWDQMVEVTEKIMMSMPNPPTEQEILEADKYV